MNRFDFSEALRLMKVGMRVTNSSGRVFLIRSGRLLCYPKGMSGHYYEVNKLFTDSLLLEDWALAEE